MADETIINADTTADAVEALEEYAVSTDKAKYSRDQLTEAQRKAAEQEEKSADVTRRLAESQERVARISTLTTSLMNKSSEELNNFNSLSSQASDFLGKLNSTLGSSSEFIKNFAGSSRTAQESFALINASIFSVRESFKDLNNVNFDGLTLVANEVNTDQFVGQMLNTLKTGGAVAVEKVFSGMFNSAIGKSAKEAAEKGVDALSNFTRNIITSVDNVRRLSAAHMQLAAATGNLNAAYTAAGPGLVNMENMMSKQISEIDNLSYAYGINNTVMQKYWSTLGQIPGALNQNVAGYDSSTKSISALHGALLLAKGSQRSFADVSSDMHDAIRFGVQDMDEAITFTSRISEITNHYGLELKDVRSHLINLGSGFRFFGNQAEGATSLVNHYVNAIKQTGVSGNVALEIVGQMTDGVQNLSLAQKAFLSAQTGGAGGLMGAFQIEKELREGGIDSVFEKARNAMKKQMGEIVTLDEAATSREAAARLTKQIQILKSGPLGSFAKDDQSAIRILEGFRNLESGKNIVKDLDSDTKGMTAREALMSKGNESLQKNNDQLVRLNRNLERQINSSMVPMTNLFQRMLGGAEVALPGAENDREHAEDAARKNRLAVMQQNTQEALNNARASRLGLNRDLETGSVTNMQQELMGQSVAGLIGEGASLKESGKTTGATATNMTKDFIEYVQGLANKTNTPVSEVAEIAQMARAGDEQSKGKLRELAAQASSSSNLGTLGPTTAVTGNNQLLEQYLPTISKSNQEFLGLQNLDSLGVRKATDASSKELSISGPASRLNSQVNPETGQVEVTGKVEVQGICIDCGKKTESQHAQIFGPAR